jgi:CheY-like chemotaxis protein
MVKAFATSGGGAEMVAMQEAEVDALDVLFIADDPDLAEMYRLQLELDGYWVRLTGPDAAVAAARDAVHRPDLPAVVLAGSTSADLMRQGASLSAVDYVVRTATAR